MEEGIKFEIWKYKFLDNVHNSSNAFTYITGDSDGGKCLSTTLAHGANSQF